MTGKRRFEVDSTVYYWSTQEGKALKGKVARIMSEGDGLPAEAGMYVLTSGKTICGEDLYEKRQQVREQAPALDAGSNGRADSSGALAAGSNGALAAGDSRALATGSGGGDTAQTETGADEKRQRIDGAFDLKGIDELMGGEENGSPQTLTSSVKII